MSYFDPRQLFLHRVYSQRYILVHGFPCAAFCFGTAGRNWLDCVRTGSRTKEACATVGTDHTPCTHASKLDMVAKPGSWGTGLAGCHCNCSGTGLPLAAAPSRKQGTEVHRTQTKEELELEHYLCFGHTNSPKNKYSVSTSASVGETLTHQKKLRGLRVSADSSVAFTPARF